MSHTNRSPRTTYGFETGASIPTSPPPPPYSATTSGLRYSSTPSTAPPVAFSQQSSFNPASTYPAGASNGNVFRYTTDSVTQHNAKPSVNIFCFNFLNQSNPPNYSVTFDERQMDKKRAMEKLKR